jgi:hypothetical protein
LLTRGVLPHFECDYGGELRAKVGATTASKQSSWRLINRPKRALGDREFFLNKSHGIGGRSKDNIP